jgi:hypothetical protein
MESVPVAIDGPVRVQTLPSERWAIARSVVTDGTGALQLLGVNPNRKRAVILSAVAAFYMAPSKGEVESRGTAAFIPLGVPVVIEHVDEVWVYNVATESPSVSAIIEYWTG